MTPSPKIASTPRLNMAPAAARRHPRAPAGRRRTAARQADGIELERRAPARQTALSRAKRPAIPERSIRWRADSCPSASARRPSSRRRCSTRTRRYLLRRSASARRTSTGDADGEIVATRPVARLARRHRSRAAAVSRPRGAGASAPRRAEASGTQVLRVRRARAWRFRGSRARS